ncbi:MAG: ribbon-helix-helix protein, CopG family [Alphaproteobacteria bacterium]|nr:ribbon-helix-helix protein, CopG family [Alphaproteobacteria bacterium]
MARITVDLGRETAARLSELAAQRGVTVSDTVNAAVVQFLEASEQPGAIYRPLGEPNADSIAAMDELDRGEVKSFTSIDSLMASLNADD